jgi:hypothetical protein
MHAEDDNLAKAVDRVEEARRIVWRQKGRIARLRSAGVDTADAERTLHVLEANLQTFQEYRAALKHEHHGHCPDSHLRGWPTPAPRLIAAE